jgi:hypothetical protein
MRTVKRLTNLPLSCLFFSLLVLKNLKAGPGIIVSSKISWFCGEYRGVRIGLGSFAIDLVADDMDLKTNDPFLKGNACRMNCMVSGYN